MISLLPVRAPPWTALPCFFALSMLPLKAEDLTLEWILNPENTRALAAPRLRWLPNETLLLDGLAKPGTERQLELFDPRSMERSPFGNPAKLLESWKGLVGESNAPKRVSMPLEIASDGRHFLYDHRGDLYLVDAEASGVRRITNTEASEGSPRFSPDGRWLAYVRDNDLHASEVTSGRERRLTRDATADRLNGTLSWLYWEELMGRRDEGYWWSPDSSALAYLQTDESMVERYPLVDHEPSMPAVQWQRYPKAGAMNPRVRAGIVELSSGETRWIELPAGSEVEYIARCRWLPDSRSLALQTLNRAQNRLVLWITDRATGATRQAHEETSRTWINLHDDLHFLPGGERYLWVSERSGHRHLHLQDLKGGPSVPVTSGEWVLRPAHGAETYPGSVAWIDSAAGAVLLHAALPSPIESQLYQVKLDGEEKRRITEGEGSHVVTVSPGGRYFVDAHSRSGVPPRVTLHRIDGSLLSVVHASSSEKLAAFSLASPQLFSVPADDGTQLSARLFRPSIIEEGRKYPAIVYLYAGPGSPAIGNRWDGIWYLWSQLLSRRGFAVFTVDPRSSSDQGKAKEDTVHRKSYGDGELKDILAGVRHLKSLPFVDPERVGIWGWSGGGTTTIYAMTRSKEFRAGIAVAGVSDQRYYDTFYTERYMGTPRENEDGYRTTASAFGVANLHGRLLIAHGTADDNVHLQNAMRLAHELIAAGKQFDFMLYPRRNHGIGDAAAREHLFRLMLDFWDRNLKG